MRQCLMWWRQCVRQRKRRWRRRRKSQHGRCSGVQMSGDARVEFGVDFPLTNLRFEELVDDVNSFREADVVIGEHLRLRHGRSKRMRRRRRRRRRRSRGGRRRGAGRWRRRRISGMQRGGGGGSGGVVLLQAVDGQFEQIGLFQLGVSRGGLLACARVARARVVRMRVVRVALA